MKPTNVSSCKVEMTMNQVKIFMSPSSLMRREDARESHVTENRQDFIKIQRFHHRGKKRDVNSICMYVYIYKKGLYIIIFEIRPSHGGMPM
jgi:hypothetical protein